jgi:hypothetical protein
MISRIGSGFVLLVAAFVLTAHAQYPTSLWTKQKTRAYAFAPVGKSEYRPLAGTRVFVWKDVEAADVAAALEAARSGGTDLQKSLAMIKALGPSSHKGWTDANGDFFFDSKAQQSILVVMVSDGKDDSRGVYAGWKYKNSFQVACRMVDSGAFAETLSKF